MERAEWNTTTYVHGRPEFVSSEFFKVRDLKPGTRVEVFFQGQDDIRDRKATVVIDINPTSQEGNPQVLIADFEGRSRSIGGGTLCRRFFEPRL